MVTDSKVEIWFDFHIHISSYLRDYGISLNQPRITDTQNYEPTGKADMPTALLPVKLQNKLPDGHYRTAAGSEVWISRNGGKSVVEFDWLEEGGCIDCTVEPYEQDGKLVWHCDECGGGSAVLQKAE